MKAIYLRTVIDFSFYCSRPTKVPASCVILCRSSGEITCDLMKLFLRAV